MNRELFSDYISITEVETAHIGKYENKLPVQILDLWKQYGFGSFYEDYL